MQASPSNNDAKQEGTISDQDTGLQVINVWYKDVTLWTNVIALAGLILSGHFGIAITPEMQVAILAILNVLLKVPRMATTRARAAVRNMRVLKKGGKGLLLGL